MLDSVTDPDNPFNAPTRAAVARALVSASPKWLSAEAISKAASLPFHRTYRALNALQKSGHAECRKLQGFEGRAPKMWRLTETGVLAWSTP